MYLCQVPSHVTNVTCQEQCDTHMIRREGFPLTHDLVSLSGRAVEGDLWTRNEMVREKDMFGECGHYE